MKRLLLMVLVAAALVPSSGARAYDDCNGQIGDFTLNTAAGPVYVPHIADGRIIPIADPATGPFYLEVRYVMGRQTSGSSTGINILIVNLYRETNNIPGLQRGGHPITPDGPGTPVYESCSESPPYDQWVF